jgi:predicted membrane-bound spermidine synthase
LALGIGFLISRYLPAGSLLTFMPKAALLGILYALIAWLFAMNQYEKNLFRSLVSKTIGSFCHY